MAERWKRRAVKATTAKGLAAVVEDLDAAELTAPLAGVPGEAFGEIFGGISGDALLLQIDRQMNERIWGGTKFEDRAFKLSADTFRNLATEIERSLVAQESYRDFEARMLKHFGIDDVEPLGVLRNLNNAIDAEAKLAWSTAMVAVNQGDTDTALVSRSRLRPGHTTAGCWARHGRLLSEIGEAPPYHWGCECDAETVPNPDSENEEVATQGRAILERMAAERDANPQPAQESARPLRPSRFVSLRELGEAA